MPIKPKLGQNFLHDTEAIPRIAAAIGDLTGRAVVEIGPGRGAITRALASRAAHVLAVELDPLLAACLRAEFSQDRVTVLEQDVLSFDFEKARADFSGVAAAIETAINMEKSEKDSENHFFGSKVFADRIGKRLLVVGNLPYGITSQILLKLAANHAALDRAVLMVQREVADRVTAQPGSRDYGLLSVTVQIFGPAERLFTLPPASFSPPPKVHSTVFRWRFAPRFAELGVEEAGFLRFVRQAFAQKRKTLANNLRAAGFPPAAVAAALTQTAIPSQARAEALPIERFASLWHCLERERAASPREAAPPSESA